MKTGSLCGAVEYGTPASGVNRIPGREDCIGSGAGNGEPFYAFVAVLGGASAIVGTMDGTRRVPDPLVTVLGPAIEAARRALLRRDTAEVPHGMRRVAQYSGPKLPPPLRKKLLDHLEEDERLRQDALEILDEVDGPAAAFLLRHAGWWREVTAAVDEAASARTDELLDRSRRQQAALHAELETTRARLGDARTRLDELEMELRAARGDAAERIEAHRRSDLDRIAELEGRMRSLETREASSAADVARLESEVAGLRRRSGRRESATVADGGDRLAAVGGDALESARILDLNFRTLRRRSVAGDPGELDEPGGIVLAPPDGLRATDPAWFDWLTSIEVPVWLVVDGHNVVFSISQDRSLLNDSMRRLETALLRLRTRAAAPLTISVIYDSNQAGDRRAPQAIGGLDVRFTSQHSIADDDIVELVESTSTPVIVVTSDRELQNRVAERADLVIDSMALARFAGAG